ncbi:hypothetical protein like AT5G35370 [Hibiscus trionum]|uniref:Receptor-like serine/threonine-protein kinase n=1 Tax=Hibiscus trionum TaxID=183268 RepID=A0A9W7ITX3_HIBTR|nr:hypothetical protein like AT5G35370 [Hibiscus trionum]
MALFVAFALLSGMVVPSSGRLYSHSILPNFTASYTIFIDNSGAFLQSPNATFRAAISNNPNQQLPQFYFSVIHSASNTIIWTANRDEPISDSARLLLTANGLVITDDFDRIIWSTRSLESPVAFLQLDDSGNLVLLDRGNVSLWESFDYPTDTLVMGQRLQVGIDFFAGEYQLLLTGFDAVLQWNGMTYWRLSMDDRAFKDSNAPASFMSVNGSGLYLFRDDGSTVVFKVTLAPINATGLDFVFAKLGSNGKFTISSYGGNELVQNLQLPAEDCIIPSICGEIGFCDTDKTCSCPSGFHNGIGSCVPIDPFFTLPKACNTSNSYGSETSDQFSYMKIGDAIDYFSTDFIEPLSRQINISYCQLLCSQNCSCLGVLYGNSSGSCYPIRNNVGSIFSSIFGLGQEDFSGYIKTMNQSSNVDPSSKTGAGRKFSVTGLVLLTSSGGFVLIVIVVGFLWWRRRKGHSGAVVVRLGSKNSVSAEIDLLSIAGLPVKFEYEELATATDNFKTQIGSGGFGAVYKAVLPNESVVAVKKITNLGVEGKKDFCTEIAIIGNIHHVNLVKLKGFCLKGKQRFLVLEYMNKGSLDRVMFDNESSVLEWKERLEIAIGTARALAYLHSGCQHKIIHCDVKPENILLHVDEHLNQNLQVKMSDFGISKLLSPEQSNLLTTLRGTRGYLAPEWLTSTGISDKSDVYSYGMVLLEIVRGRRNFSIQLQSNNSHHSPLSTPKLQRLYFPLLALEMHEQKRYTELVDPRLEGRAKSEEVERLVRVALCCLQMEPFRRPTMSNVVGMLEGRLPVGQPRMESLNFLRYYGGRYAEAVTISTDGCNGISEFIMDFDHP